MSLSTVETALIEYVGDVIVNDCRRPEPERVLRYHGTLPHDCCSEAGFLVVNWASLVVSDRFPGSSTGAAPCPGIPVATLALRYVVCWDIPEADSGGGIALMDETWDETAAMLADVTDCVARSLMRVQCDPDLSDPYVAALVADTPRHWFRFIDAAPIVPAGGCAGVTWRVNVGVSAGPVVS